MARAESGPVVAVVILKEQKQVAPIRILLKFPARPVYRRFAAVISQENPREAAFQLNAYLPQIHQTARPGGTLHAKVVSQKVMESLQRFDDQIIDRKPDRPPPVGIASEEWC